MTRMHFQRIADALRATRKACAIDGQQLTDEQYEILVDQLALTCSEFNNKFQYGRFTDACNKS